MVISISTLGNTKYYMMYPYYLEYVNPTTSQTVDFHDLRSNVIHIFYIPLPIIQYHTEICADTFDQT